ncbi:hypothetical protein Fcan01_26533 [Folsomia candida]|uniref:Uncharacterized protein n=1 Tax=Folsomia candida TaxID=158441 RepID=A0A226D1S0_FOLCA|nr:hypothetical protein Fcan01_26533 [Folsomia candida]
MDNEASSYKLYRGSCVELHTAPYPYRETYLVTTERQIPTLVPTEFNDRISSVKRCRVYDQSFRCPEDTYVKHIEWNNQDKYLSQIFLHCSKPETKGTDTKVFVKYSGNNKTTRVDSFLECPIALRGIRLHWDKKPVRGSVEALVGMTPLCHLKDAPPDTAKCPDKHAIVGAKIRYEEHCN